jgi:predicted acetyltransferase
MGIEIRAIDADETIDWFAAVFRGFHNAKTSDETLAARRDQWDGERMLAAFDDGRIVATYRTLALPTTMPGGAPLTSCAVTAVTTASTHRRRGILRQMIERSLADARERGEPLSTLIAAEYPIYGRFGYGAATEHASYTLDARAQWLVDGHGTIEMVDSDTLVELAPAIYDRHRTMNVSEITRDDFVTRSSVLGPPGSPLEAFHAVCRNAAGDTTGYVTYSIKEDFDGRRANCPLTVHKLISADVDAEISLWRYVASVDWVRTVTADDRSVDERLPWWLVDGRDVVQTERSDFVWARPLDTATCLVGRTYRAPVDVVIEVVDPLGIANGCVRLVADPTGVTCARCDASPDVTLPVATLGSILFGGYSLTTLWHAGRADEHAPGTIARLDTAMRGNVAPWSATWF